MGDPQLRAWFSSVDLDHSGQVNAAELQRALALGNLQFGLSDVDAMIRAFDVNNSRTLGFDEFARLHYFLTNVTNSFRQFDRDRSGSLSQDEVNQALIQAGFQLDPPAVAAMMNKYDPDNNKVLSLDEYIRACLFLQTSARSFSAFDPRRTGAITVNFSQLIYMAAHIC